MMSSYVGSNLLNRTTNRSKVQLIVYFRKLGPGTALSCIWRTERWQGALLWVEEVASLTEATTVNVSAVELVRPCMFLSAPSVYQ